MSQFGFADDFGDDWLTSSQLEKVEHVLQSQKTHMKDYVDIDSKEPSTFSDFLDELILNPIATKSKSQSALGDITNKKKRNPPVKSKKQKEVPKPTTTITPKQSEWTSFDPSLSTIVEIPTPLNTNSFGGFSTARGNKIPPPSMEAKKRAEQLFKEMNDIPSENDALQQDITKTKMSGFTTASGSTLKPPSESARQKALQLFQSDDISPMPSFTTGSGSALKPPSESAKQKALELFKSDDIPAISAFTTASGTSLKPPSEHAKKNAAKLLEMDELPPTFATAAGNTLKPPNKQAMANADALLSTADGKQKDLKYEKTIQQFGGFQMGNSKKEYQISSQAKRKAIAVYNDVEEKKESTADIVPKSITDSPPRKIVKRAPGVKIQNRQFKSPIIHSKYELTKAAVSNRNMTKRRATPVFDLTLPKDRYNLKSLGEPLQYTRTDLAAKNIPFAIINMTASTAKKYVFEGNWGPAQARHDMLNAGAVSARTPMAWVENHYGCIVWKMASLIRSYPDRFNKDWNSRTILNQLLYRYEREVNMGQRPVLKKVLEQDVASMNHMVLLIAEIIEINQPIQHGTSYKYKLILTDGWYQVPACIDCRMEKAITKKRLKIGSKLSVNGAKIVGDQEPRSPLEITNTVLSISSNSCLPAKWDTKLGYHPKKLSIRSISTLYDDGGMIRAVEIIVCRKFPILFSESMENGSTVTRTLKEEYEARQGASEKNGYHHTANISVNFKADQHSKRLNPSANNESKNNTMDDRRGRTSGYFKIRICDASNHNNSTYATLLLTNVDEIIHGDVGEGRCFRVSNIMPYHPKNKKYPGLDVKTTRATRWEPLKGIDTTQTAYLPRFLTVCKDIRQRQVHEDFDLVVLVLQTGTATIQQLNGRTLWHQTLLVTDESQAVCQIEFRLPFSPFSDIKGQTIALVNLRFEMYDGKFDITCLRATDESEIITKSTSHSEYIQLGIQKLKQWVQENPRKVELVTSRFQNILQ